MRKYRLTKIMVKTREIISMSKSAQDSECPLCHQSLSALLPADESSAFPPHAKQRPAEFPPLEFAAINKRTN